MISVRGARMRFRAGAWLCAFAMALGLLCGTPAAHADPTLVHIVRQGETLASVAELWYGDPRRESVLVSENGLSGDSSAPIAVGLRLMIPTVGYHHAQDGETWAELATRYYGDPRRAFELIQANGGKASEHPDVGAELLIPYPLRVVASPGDALRKIAKTYYDSMAAMSTVRRFNPDVKGRIQHGQLLLAPLSDLVLSAQGKKLAEAQLGTPQVAGDLRDRQKQIDAELPALREDVHQGRYADAVAAANRMIGEGDLTSSQLVTIHRELGTAYVALGREDLAKQAFVKLLSQQPDAEFDSVRTSPKVLRVIDEARKIAAAAAAKAAAEAKANPAGSAKVNAAAGAKLANDPPAQQPGAPALKKPSGGGDHQR